MSDQPRKCQHGYDLCVHGRCELDCGSVGCESGLEHEYHCDCEKRGCDRGDFPGKNVNKDPCRGDCGCGGCKRAYSDFADFE